MTWISISICPRLLCGQSFGVYLITSRNCSLGVIADMLVGLVLLVVLAFCVVLCCVLSFSFPFSLLVFVMCLVANVSRLSILDYLFGFL